MSKRGSGRLAMAGRKELGKDTRGMINTSTRGRIMLGKAAGTRKVTKQRHVASIRNVNIG